MTSTDADETSQNEGGSVVNQDEINSLVESGSDAEEGGIQAIVNSALVSYERLPMLEVVFDRLVRRLTTSLRNFTSDNVDVTLDEITSVRFGHHLNGISGQSILAVFAAKEWDNFGLLVIDSALTFSMVDVLLGGRRSPAEQTAEDRPYTTIERSLVETLVGVILGDLSKAFRPLSPVTFAFERLETNPRFATIARPANAAIVITLSITMEDRGGKVELLLPYATLEPVRELLLQRFLGEKFGRDSIWEGHLATELWCTEIEIAAVLDEKVMDLGEVMQFELGDTLMFNCSKDSDVELRCGTIPLMIGKMGRVDKTVAIKVTDEIRRSTEEEEGGGEENASRASEGDLAGSDTDNGAVE